MKSLAGLHAWLAERVKEIQVLALSLLDAGGIALSVLLPEQIHQQIKKMIAPAGPRVSFDHLSIALTALRWDGIQGYDGASVDVERLMTLGLGALKGRAVLCTKADAQTGALAVDPGSNVCLIEVESDGRGFRILYGNEQFGNVPTRGLPGYLLTHATKGGEVVLHAHPRHVNALMSHPSISCCEHFNDAIQEQLPSFVLQDGALIEEGFQPVSVLPFLVPGSDEFLTETVAALLKKALRANIDETESVAIITEQGGQENHREGSQDGSFFCSQFA